MPKMNEMWYVDHNNGKRGTHPKLGSPSRTWFFVKASPTSETGMIHLGDIHFPPSMRGKRVRIKIELLEDEEDE